MFPWDIVVRGVDIFGRRADVVKSLTLRGHLRSLVNFFITFPLKHRKNVAFYILNVYIYVKG